MKDNSLSILQLARPEILAMKGYSSARNEFAKGGGQYVWLDANENPWSPFPGKGTAVGLNRYPDPQPEPIVEKLASLYGTSADQVLVTRGSDEGIDLLVRAFCRAGQDAVLTMPPTFGYFGVAAQVQGAAIVEVPLLQDKGFAVDWEGLRKALEDSSVHIVFFCSPNNPTAGSVDPGEILRLCDELKGRAFVVVDEAYQEFASVRSLAPDAGQVQNLAVLRTMSKAYGLAGARLGALVAHPQVIGLLRKIIAPYPLPQPTVQAVEQALSPFGLDVSRDRVAMLLEERTRVASALEALPEVKKVWPSDTNFLLVQVDSPSGWMEKTRKAGVILRDRSGEVEGSVRVTIGTPEENDLLLRALGASVVSGVSERTSTVSRKTRETDIHVSVNLDRTEPVEIQTGIGFFDHMLDQVARHGGFALRLRCKGDLHVDVHHTVEDCGIALGQAIREALGEKKGLTRYGFVLPMDETQSRVAIDLSGRPAFEFQGEFPDRMVGAFPVEMVSHFFQSLSVAMAAAIQINVQGENTHHMIEACFKGFARAMRMALKVEGTELPSTKGVL